MTFPHTARVEDLGSGRVRLTWADCGHSVVQEVQPFMARYWSRGTVTARCPRCWRRVGRSMKWVRREAT